MMPSSFAGLRNSVDANAFESAFSLHASGALVKAEAAYREILAADPRHAGARHYLGVLLHTRGQTQEGISMIVGALELDAGDAGRFNDLGNILVQSGDLTNAAIAFRSSLDLDDRDPSVWNNLGSVHHSLRNLTDAEGAYRAALARDAVFVPALNNLASLLAQTGREDESSLLACLAFIQPPLGDKAPRMLAIAYYRLGRIADAADCYRDWLHAEPGNEIARHQLAACTGEEVPAQASEGFVTATFDGMAGEFDEKLLGSLSYQGPAIIAGLLEGITAADGTLDVLDAGCGTGLCAPGLRPHARHLTGVDLSAGMLARARARNLYDTLVEAELMGYLVERGGAFDLIAMADTLIYFGDVVRLFAATGRALRPGGKFAFTAEATQAPDRTGYRLGPSGRYAHSARYLEGALEATGFTIVGMGDVVLRTEFCRPVEGFGVLAQVTR